MFEQTEKNSKFLDAINKSAMEHCRDMEEEVRRHAKKEMEQEEARIHDECHKRMDREVQKIRSAATSKLAAYRIEQIEELSRRRNEIQRQVFAAAYDKILDFTKTDTYKEQLLNSANKIVKLINTDDTVVFLRRDDMAFAENIKKLFTKASIVEDEQNVLGGLKAQSASLSLSVDDTFASRLEEQKDRFTESSKLKIV